MVDNFLGLDKKYSDKESSKIVVVPVPFDKTTSYIHGANRGPKALIKASKNLELYDIETDSEVYKMGVFTSKFIKSKTSLDMLQSVEREVYSYLQKDKFVVTLGGEHSISLAPIRAHANYYKKISVVHFDAHLDSRDFYDGSKYNHACVMARVKEIEEVSQIVSIGIRSMDVSERKNLSSWNVFFAHDIYSEEFWMDVAISKLSELVYITFDLDLFDSSIMPSTGTPEPGGLQWYTVMKFLKKLAKKNKIIGFDVVELCPIKNFVAPDFLAAKLVYKILSYGFFKKED